MKKTLIIIGMSILTILAVFLLFFKGKEDNKTTKKKTEQSYEEYSTQRHAEQEKICEIIVKKITDAEVWDEKLTDAEKERIRYHNVSDDGLGILFISFSEDGTFVENYIYASRDYGTTWKRQNKEVFWSRREGTIYTIKENIFFFVMEGSNMGGYKSALYISDDAGIHFWERDLKKAVGLNMKSDLTVESKVIKIDNENQKMIVEWYPFGDDTNNTFLTAEYDIDFRCTKVLNRNDKVYEILPIFDNNRFVFLDSNKRYLTREEIVEYEDACEILEECSGRNLYIEDGSIISLAINDIYARRGYDYRNTEYSFRYEEGQSQYCDKLYSDIEIVAEQFNEYEQANVDLLAELREEFGQ